jgi:ABC-2 type transport system ATP-binding protein
VDASEAVRFEDVTKIFRDFWGRARVEAVSGLSLAIPRASIFGLLGPNGSGKTTSLSLLLGLLRPSAGRITVLGSAPGERGVRSRIGYLPEDFSPPELLRGEEVLAYYGGLHRLGGAELRRRVDFFLELLDLEDARRRRFREYSKGMQRRIGLAQALLHGPELLVLDEPTNGLDPMGVRTVKELLRDQRAQGRTVIVCSHVLPELEEVCDRIAILHRGRLICEGPTRDLLSVRDRCRLVIRGSLEHEAAAARRLLVERGFEVLDVLPEERTLENVFLDHVLGSSNPAPGLNPPAPPADKDPCVLRKEGHELPSRAGPERRGGGEGDR